MNIVPASTRAAVAKVQALEAHVARLPQLKLTTRHVIHAGMYARTITIPAGVVLTGALIKRATLLIVSGVVQVFTGEESVLIEGYHVIPASAGRKTAYYALEDTDLTMVFPTNARTVQEAEREFTDDVEMLMSRVNENEVIITGE